MNEKTIDAMPSVCYVSLGSNMGSTKDNLAKACDLLCSTRLEELFFSPIPKEFDRDAPPLQILASSRIYSTEPQNVKDQPYFLNQVLQVTCMKEVTPFMVLHRLLAIEKTMGRVRTKRFGPRIIDLDLLLFNNVAVTTPELILPHPRMSERAFVLIPLTEIDATLTYPLGGNIIDDLQKLTYSIENEIIYQY